MAADVYGLLGNTELPYGWEWAITSDGRVFFINEYDQLTTWINPVTGEPVQSGHTTSLGLPRGWELGYTRDKIKYFINHNQRDTTFVSPLTGKAEALQTASWETQQQTRHFEPRLGLVYGRSPRSSATRGHESPSHELRSPYTSTLGAGSPRSNQHPLPVETHQQPSSSLKCPESTLNQLNTSKGPPPLGQRDTNHSSVNAHHQQTLLSGPTYDDYVDVYTNKQPANNPQLPLRERERQVGRQGGGFPSHTPHQRTPAPAAVINPTWSGAGAGTSVDQAQDITSNDHTLQNNSPFTSNRLSSQANLKFLTNSPITPSKSKSSNKTPSNTPKRGSVKKSKKMNGPQVKTRPLDAPVTLAGWLYKFESNTAGVRKWKRRYFVLQDFCLYTYKDATQSEIIDSVLLPSYRITKDNKYNKPLAFKAEHNNMKTIYLAADHEDSLNNWIVAMRRASNMQKESDGGFMPPEFNRTEGDGTDSPMVASPFRDQTGRDKFSSPGYTNGRHQSPGAHISPRHSWQRPSSINIPKSQDYKPPPSSDPRWSTPGPVPYNDWQVREHGYDQGYHDGYNQPPRSYTPPIPPNNPVYDQQSPVKVQPLHYQHEHSAMHTSNPNYEYHDSIDYPSSSPQRALDNYNTPYSPPRPQYERRMNEYVLDDTPARPSHLDLSSGRRGGPVPHQPVLSQAYRTPSNAYNFQSHNTNNEPPPPPQPQYDPYGFDDDRRQEYGAHGVAIRGEQRTPQSVVSPPWKRDNPQTPTYRPPHYENLPSTAESTPSKHRASTAAGPATGEPAMQGNTPPPPRPQKLTPQRSLPYSAQQQVAESSGGVEQANDRQAQASKPEPFNPQKWRDQLQAKKSNARKLNDPLIFQYPTPYRAPDWLKDQRSAPPAAHSQVYPVMSRNNSNNNTPQSRDTTFLDNTDRGSVAYFATPEDNRDEGKHNDYLQLPRNTESVQPSDPKTIILRDVERRTRTLTNDRSTPRKQPRSLTRKPCPPEHHMQSHPSSSPMVVIEGSIERPGSVMTEEIVSAFSPPLRRSKSLPRSAQPMRNRYPPVSNTELSQGMPYNQTPQSGPYQGVPAFKPPSKVITRGKLSANDLVGKSQEELVLLLIELRREQSQLESSIDTATQRLGHARIELDRLHGRREDSSSINKDVDVLKDYVRSTEKQIDIQKPLIHLVDNMVKMSSMHGSGNRQQSDKRKMMEFSRRLEEQQVTRDHRAANSSQRINGQNHSQSTLNGKLEELYQSDLAVQRHSELINKTSQQMRVIEDELRNINNLLSQGNHSLFETNQMIEDRQKAEYDLTQLRKKMSSESRQMEQLNSQNSTLQEEVMRLRSQLKCGAVTRAKSLQALHPHNRDLEGNVQRTQGVVDGLQKQNRALTEAMSSLKVSRSQTESDTGSSIGGAGGTYYETDVDTMNRRDISLNTSQNSSPARPPWARGSSTNVSQGQVRAKPMSMRDMKRQSASRHEQPPSYSQSQHNRPRPASAYEPGSQPDFQLDRQSANRSSATDRLFNHSTNSSSAAGTAFRTPNQAQPNIVKPMATRGRAQARRKENKARYLTISSSQPLQLEAANIQKSAPNTFNRPLRNGEIVKSSSAIDRDYTQDVIDSQLFAPQKVHIPERYVPDSSDEEEVISHEERLRRAEKAEQIRKMVASQSAANAFQIARESVQAHRELLMKKRSNSYREEY